MAPFYSVAKLKYCSLNQSYQQRTSRSHFAFGVISVAQDIWSTVFDQTFKGGLRPFLDNKWDRDRRKEASYRSSASSKNTIKCLVKGLISVDDPKFELQLLENIFYRLQRGHRSDQEVVGCQHGASLHGLEEP